MEAPSRSYDRRGRATKSLLRAGVAGLGLLLTLPSAVRGSSFPPLGDPGTVVIDNFEDPGSVANLLIDDIGFNDYDIDIDLYGYNVIGGFRRANLSAIDAQEYPDQYVAMNINEASSGLCFMTSSSTLFYDGTGGLTYGGFMEGEALDLQWRELMEIIIDVDGFPAKESNVVVQLWSRMDTPEQKGPAVLKTLITSDSSLSFPLSEFTDLDPTDVDQIEITFSIPAGQSLAIGDIYAIPEPGTAVVLLVGFLGVLRRRTRG
jgi:hypothetical protein